MVADVHRTLLYGGIFMYPADSKVDLVGEGTRVLSVACAFGLLAVGWPFRCGHA